MLMVWAASLVVRAAGLAAPGRFLVDWRLDLVFKKKQAGSYDPACFLSLRIPYSTVNLAFMPKGA